MKEIVTNLKKFGKSIFICLLYLIIIPGIAYSFLITNSFNSYSPLKQNLLLTLCQVFAFLFVIFIFRKTLIADFEDFKTNFKKYLKPSLKYWLISLGIMILVNFLINYVLFKGSMALNEEVNRASLTAYPLYSILTLILIGPIAEELIFRANFKNGIRNEKLFLVFTSLLFAGMHLLAYFDTLQSLASSWQQLLYIIPYGALGFAFGLAYLKTKNIYSAIMIHMLQNILSVTIILISL